MKYFLTIACSFFIGTIFAQRTVSGGTGASEALYNAGNAAISGYGNSAVFYNPKKKAEGSVHLFKDWNNYAVIITSDNQRFALKNINLNIERNTFESKVSGDSIFTFNFNNINKFVINNKAFKNFYYKNQNRVFEIVFESNEFSILKGYRVELIEGSVNPMVNRKNDKYVQKSSFYLKQGSNIKPFKVRKKNVLSLVDGNKERADKIMKLVNK